MLVLTGFLAGAAVQRRLDALRDDARVEQCRVEQVIWGGLWLLGVALLAALGCVVAGGLNVLSAGLLGGVLAASGR